MVMKQVLGTLILVFVGLGCHVAQTILRRGVELAQSVDRYSARVATIQRQMEEAKQLGSVPHHLRLYQFPFCRGSKPNLSASFQGTFGRVAPSSAAVALLIAGEGSLTLRRESCPE